MTTYNSFEAAKIANPDSDIYKSPGTPRVFTATPNSQLWFKCNPADHCMTAQQFLKAGHKFVEGDIILDDGHPFTVKVNPPSVGLYYTLESSNKPEVDDNTRYILRAAALENGRPNQYESVAKDLAKKRTKVEYVKVDFDKVSDLVIACESGEVFYCDNSIGDKNALEMYGAISMHRHSDNLYRRIETPIEWWEDVAEFMSELAELSITEDGELRVMMLEGQIGFGMSRDKWRDFARILLEQGE